MTTLTTPLLAGLLAFAPLFAQAQSECSDYHKFNCERSTDARFSVNGQSRSASVQVGVPTELNIIVYKGQDYRISFCYDEKVLGVHIVARLIEKTREPKEVTEESTAKQDVLDADGNPTGTTREVKETDTKTVYEEKRTVLWDNQEHEMANAVEFTATATKRIAIEVIAPGAEDDGKAKRKDTPYDIGCVGILIEHMPTPNIGF
ncbi:MAG TPA: hypothetical protein VHL57_00745 [Flavobacteriales bacterium]|jgi:hypothetical protein|nr:hypothetical protein [Flavobacteriales bacterium]